ncbi:hypothetical protein [Mesorhizobium sp. M0130]|uniref:hypothetical protein n=1 Tax=Mesorhizobium sp. M0130 TaxID=2956887 RepID=UPI00333992AD
MLNGETKYVDGGTYLARVNERGVPVQFIGRMADFETAARAANAMGPDYVAGTWTYRKH